MRAEPQRAGSAPLALLIAVGLAIAASGATAQVSLAPGYWSGWTLGGIGTTPCPICVFQPGHPTATSFNPSYILAPVTAKHLTGQVLVASAGSLESWDLAGQVGPTVSIPGIGYATGLAVTPQAGVWVLGFGAGGTPLSRIDAAGPGIQTYLAQEIGTIIRTDENGTLWLVTGGSVRSVDALGQFGAPVVPPNTGVIRDFDIGPSQRMYALNGDTDLQYLNRWRLDGTLLWVEPVPGARAFDLDLCGRPHVLRTLTGGAQVIEVRHPDTGAVEQSFHLGTGTAYDGITLDTAGRMWLSAFSSSTHDLNCISTGGLSLGSWNLTGTPLEGKQGDPTGVHLVSVVDPNGDADLDGHSNAVEIARGCDPGDASSVPTDLSVLSGIPSGGQTFELGAILPAEAGFSFTLAASSSLGSTQIDPTCRRVPIAIDPISLWWYGPGNTLVPGVWGVVDGSGRAALPISLPSGLPAGPTGIWFVLVTLDGSYIPQTLSNAWELVLQ